MGRAFQTGPVADSNPHADPGANPHATAGAGPIWKRHGNSSIAIDWIARRDSRDNNPAAVAETGDCAAHAGSEPNATTGPRKALGIAEVCAEAIGRVILFLGLKKAEFRRGKTSNPLRTPPQHRPMRANVKFTGFLARGTNGRFPITCRGWIYRDRQIEKPLNRTRQISPTAILYDIDCRMLCIFDSGAGGWPLVNNLCDIFCPPCRRVVAPGVIQGW